MDDDIQKILQDHGFATKSKVSKAGPAKPASPAEPYQPDFITARQPAWEKGATLPTTDFNRNAPPAATAAPAEPPADTAAATEHPDDTTVTKGIPGVVPGIKIDPLDRDFARGVLKLGGQARRLGHWLAPHLESTLEELAKKVPGAQAAVRAGREFAHQPEEEPFGETLGETAPLLAADPLLAAARIAPVEWATKFGMKYLPRTGARAAVAATPGTPAVAATAPRTVAGTVYHLVPGKGFQPFPITRTFPGTPAIPAVPGTAAIPASAGRLTPGSHSALRWIRRGLAASEVPVKSAAGGALGDPEHPKEGAEAGLVATGAIPLAAATKMGGHLLTKKALGALGHNITWLRSPIGRQLKRVGHFILDEANRVIGHIAPAVGHAGGEFEERHPNTLSTMFPTHWGPETQPEQD